MKRRNFLAWCGAASIWGFFGGLLRRKPPIKGWYFEEVQGFTIVNKRSLYLRCDKCGAQYDPVSEDKKFHAHRAQCRALPRTIDTNHPESLRIEVIGLDGEPMPMVRKVDTKSKKAEQYRRRTAKSSREWYAKRGEIPPQTVTALDPKTHEPIVDVVPYSHLRMKDGRDVMEALGV